MNALPFPAVAYPQGPDRTLYAFTATGDDLDRFATVSRIEREDDGPVQGYQRPEALAHIAGIRAYLDSDRPMLPNALVVALGSEVDFEPVDGGERGEQGAIGTLRIPLDPDAPDHEKPGWVVDGQQRLAALREAGRPDFRVCVVAFVAESLQEQREQFILVNATKPLPKGLIYELLPETGCTLPTLLQKRRFPAYLMERLNYQADSPFHRKIKTPTNPDGIVQDNSVLKMLENSLSDGALYRFRSRPGLPEAEGDVEAMVELVSNFWTAVAETFPDAWAKPPRHSRLTHGAGIVSLGYIMDAIDDRLRAGAVPSAESFRDDLAALAPVCRWTHGFWEFGPGAQRRWNEVQNTSSDIRTLTNYLIVQYKQVVWNGALRSAAPDM
ncbi:MAG: hypothetical protein SangKO_099990 [Sandaracinaceae bacterium]